MYDYSNMFASEIAEDLINGFGYLKEIDSRWIVHPSTHKFLYISSRLASRFPYCRHRKLRKCAMKRTFKRRQKARKQIARSYIQMCNQAFVYPQAQADMLDWVRRDKGSFFLDDAGQVGYTPPQQQHIIQN